jgi:hypothetical protein
VQNRREITWKIYRRGIAVNTYVSRTMQAIFDGSRNCCEIAWKIYCMEIAVDMIPENAGNL